MSENNNGKRNRIPRGYTAEDTQRRLDWLKNEQGFALQDLPANDPEVLKGIIENHVGYMKIPMSVVGPAMINGNYANGKYSIPLCTIEGTLAASMNRGLYASSLCGGINVKHYRQELSRAPIFIFDDLNQCQEFQVWVNEHMDDINDYYRWVLRIDHKKQWDNRRFWANISKDKVLE